MFNKNTLSFDSLVINRFLFKLFLIYLLFNNHHKILVLIAHKNYYKSFESLRWPFLSLFPCTGNKTCPDWQNNEARLTWRKKEISQVFSRTKSLQSISSWGGLVGDNEFTSTIEIQYDYSWMSPCFYGLCFGLKLLFHPDLIHIQVL